ncbi:MAG: phage minor head protein [Chlamydiota bacterium]
MCHLCEQIDRMDAADRLRIEQSIDWLFGDDGIVERAKKKEKNPLINRDLVAFEVTLSDSLRKIADAEGDAAKTWLMKFLDESFTVTDASAKELVEMVSTFYPHIGSAIAESAVPVTEETAQEIIRLARKHIAVKPAFSKLPEDWAMTWNLRDDRALEALARKPAMWIGDYYSGPKIDQVRAIVDSAMAKGLGRDQTAALLKEALGVTFDDYRYWDVLSSSVTTKARSWSILTGMQDAGYEVYIWHAAGDERSCESCLAMDGREFSVAKAIRNIEATFDLEDKDQAKDKLPWLSWDPERKDMYYKKGDRSVYVGNRGSESLQNSGIGTPPLHGRCRCTLVLAEQ